MSDRYQLGSLVSLLKHAAMSASYKPALLRAIVACIQRGNIAEGHIALTDLAGEFLAMYWTQSVVFRFRHSPRTDAAPEIVQRILEAANSTGTRDLGSLPTAMRIMLKEQIARILTINVLKAFHVSKPPSMPLLFTWSNSEKFIRLSPEAVAFVWNEAQALTIVANYFWARFLTRLNAAPRIIDKLERERPRRSKLYSIAHMLTRLGESNCFYCGVALNDLRPMHIDHFVPWAFVFDDKIWNLVATCTHCNVAKSDILPDESFLPSLIALNQKRRGHQSESRRLKSLGADAEGQLNELFHLALSEEWPSGWKPIPGRV
jgi:5-methylcytosine-specific restriction endonuclease McrA